MADARMPEKFYELARPMLPAEKQPGPQGGRPPSGHYIVLKVIWFVLVTGCRWKDVPTRDGLLWRNRTHATASLGACRHLGSTSPAAADHAASREPTASGDGDHRLDAGAGLRRRRGDRPRAPSIAAKKGRNTRCWSIATACRWCFARWRPIAATSWRSCRRSFVSRVPGKPGRPRTHPDKLYADAGFDCEATRSMLRWLGIEPHIRHRNGDHGSHLGRVRWVGGTHHQLDQRSASHARSLRSLGNVDRRLDEYRRSRRLLTDTYQSDRVAYGFFIYEVFWQPISAFVVQIRSNS